MNAPRRSKVVTGPASRQLDGWMGVLQGQLNNILTGFLIVAAIILFVRWRMKTAEMNKLAVGNELANARTFVLRLRQGQIPGSSPADLIRGIQSLETEADTSISTVLNSSDATPSMRGQAFVLRGDLYWQLANLPEMPGSASEPTLRLSETPDVLLQKSFDAYSEVAKNTTYADEHESLNAAYMGLGAIAENRGDWRTATEEFQAVVDDKKALAVLVTQANIQLLEIPTLQKGLYVAPPSGMASLIGPMVPTHMPSTTQISATTLPVIH